MQQVRIIQDNFRRHYRVCTPGDGSVHAALVPENFRNPMLAENFVRRLKVSTSYWQPMLSKFDTGSFNSNATIEGRIGRLLVQGTIKIYRVKHLDEQASTSSAEKSKLSLSTVNGKSYTLQPVSALLENPSSEVKTFTSEEQAVNFLAELNMDEAQQDKLATAMDIPVANKNGNPNTAKDWNPDAQIAAMALALLNNQFVIASSPPRITPRTTNNAENAPTENTPGKPSSLGAHEEQGSTYTRNGSVAAGVVAVANEVVADEVKPPCTLEKAVIKCSHGTRVEITEKTLSAPNLNVIATETDKAGFDLISAEIHASELCSSHKNSSFSITKEHTLKSKTENKIEFKVNCARWERSNIFERIWLPSVKPKTYSLAVKDTCETPDNFVKKVNINVYPDIKWHWSTKIDFGKLEFIPGKAKVKYSDFAIDGNVDLTYDGKKHDAKEKYEEYIKKPLDGFKKICDSIGEVLEVINNPKAALMRIGTQTNLPKPAEGDDNSDGNETRLVITWPKLNIDYDSTFIENTKNNCVEHDYRIKLTAKPLLDIDIQVDVLDSMISLAPLPVAELIRYAKKRVEQEFEDDQQVGFRGELDIIFTVKATVNINESEIEGRQNVTENNVSVKPVKGDIKIPAKLKGAVKAEGKWFVISFNVHYEMSGETEWSGNYEFGNDDKGIYFSNTVEFKGIDITLTKYEEVKAELETEGEGEEGDTADDFLSDIEVKIENHGVEGGIKFEDGKIKGEATAKAKEEKRWSWLKPSEDSNKEKPVKYYIVKR